MIRLAFLATLAVHSSLAIAADPISLSQGEMALFTESTMEHLFFLEGRWSGTAPDGTVFYEAYDRPDPFTLRNQRYEDASFSKVTDGSIVAYKDGQITSTWGDFVWRASDIIDGRAAFEPVNAPSSFVWLRVDTNTVEVTQNWTDETGAPQTYSLTLNRVQ